MPEQPLVSTGSSGIQFFDSLLPLTQSVRPPLVPYHCALLVLLTGGYAAPLVAKYFLSNLYLEKQDFSRGRKHRKYGSAHIPRLLPIKRYYLLGSMYVLGLAAEH